MCSRPGVADQARMHDRDPDPSVDDETSRQAASQHSGDTDEVSDTVEPDLNGHNPAG